MDPFDGLRTFAFILSTDQILLHFLDILNLILPLALEFVRFISLQSCWTRSALTLPRPPRSTRTVSLWHRHRLHRHQSRSVQIHWTVGAVAQRFGHHPAQTPMVVLLPPRLLPTSRIRRLIICFHSLVVMAISNRVAVAALARASMAVTRTMPMTTRHSLAVWPPLPPLPETAHHFQTTAVHHNQDYHHRQHPLDAPATACAVHYAPPRFAFTRAWRH